jgi:hypothetical protein
VRLHVREKVPTPLFEPARGPNFDAFLQENITQAESFGSPPAAIEQIRATCGRLKAAYPRGGHAAVARCTLDHAAQQAHADGSADLRFAVLHAQAGDLDDAFRWLDRALDSHDPVARASRRGAAMGRSARRSAVSAAACADGTSLDRRSPSLDGPQFHPC